VKLFKDQERALDRIESESLPIFVTGAAGTGKSQLLRHLRDFGIDADGTEVVAFTGAAAVNVEGRTIHNLVLNSKAWNQSIQIYGPLRDSREIKKSSLAELSNLKLLIIDEVSMVRADMIDAIDRALRNAKGNDEPFGGVRLVMFGDVRQLPPFVVSYQLLNREARFLSGYENPRAPYFFMAHVFSLIPIIRIELTEQKRVMGDGSQPFIDALNGLRRVPPDERSIQFVNENSSTFESTDEMFLFSERRPARKHNLVKLLQLPGDSKVYKAKFKRFELEEFDEEAAEKVGDDFPAPRHLELRVSARVMVVANLDITEGLVNGAMGVVERMTEEGVVVRLDRTGKSHLLLPHSFDWKGLALDSDVVEGEVKGQSRGKRRTKIIGSYLQVPLMQAWAVTIHKAQGATLDRAAIDFDSQYHSAGQAYVALSRLTSISGLSRKGELGRWHFSPYSPYLDKFEILQPAKKKSSNLEKTISRVMPWRSLQEIESTLDNNLEIIPQVRDYERFSHRRRMIYLRDQGLMAPSTYLRSLYDREPENAVFLCRNIDRSMRNKPLVHSFEVLGNELEVELRDELEITLDDYRRLESMFGSGWRERALEQVGRGRDVPIDVIPEFEITSINFLSPMNQWDVYLDPDPVSKERVWMYRHPKYLHPRDYPRFVSLAALLVDVREDWEGMPGILIDIRGTMEEGRVEKFLPYLGVDITNLGQIRLNGDRVTKPVLKAAEVVDSPRPVLVKQDFADYPEQRFSRGEVVLLSIGSYAGRQATVLEIDELDFVQYLTVQPEGFPDPITIRGNYAQRINESTNTLRQPPSAN
jgi:hypothetical protein